MQLKIPWWNQTQLDNYNERPQRGPDLPAFGASIIIIKPHVFWLGCQNINGMKIVNSHSGAKELETMHQLGIHIFGMI